MFIVFEGLDGCGKSTQAQLLAQALEKRGHTVVLEVEPTKNGIGLEIREVLSGKTSASNEKLALLFAADRALHIDKILADICAGCTVICDRYLFSSLAYQSLGLPLMEVFGMNKTNAERLMPDAVIYIDLPVEHCISRITSNRAAYEIFETREQLCQIKQNYEASFELFDDLRLYRIDGVGSENQVHMRILEALGI